MSNNGPSDQGVKANCKNCGPKRNHVIRAEFVDRDVADEGEWEGEWWESSYQIVQCNGCDNVSVLVSKTASVWADVDYDRNGKLRQTFPASIDQFPPQTYRKRPDWCEGLPELLVETLGEVYLALQVDCLVLASIGARTVIDIMIVELVGDVGSFDKKLKHLVDKGWIGEKHRQFLSSALDAGSASAHRGHSPNPKDMNMVIDIVENVLQAAFVLGKHGEEIRKRTPQRPPKK